MKKNNLKIWSVAYLLFFVLFTGTMFAQSINLTGTFEGLRSQYDQSHKNFTQEFQYKFDLKQEGNVVTGISTIISDEGNYAEVGIRGIVLKDKFYFEEFDIRDQITAHKMVWCYKHGVLDIDIKDNEVVLSGETPSNMAYYGYACSGGFTKVSAFNEIQTEELAQKSSLETSNFEFTLFPNPTVEKINFSFEVTEKTNVSFEILDLTGKRVFKSTERQIEKGNFTEYIQVEKMGLSKGLYIFNLKLNNTISSKEFVVAK